MLTHSTKDGRTIILRTPAEQDALAIIMYSKLIFTSTDQVLTIPDEYSMTVEEERLWLNSFQKNPNSLLLVAELEQEIVGMLFFIANHRKKNSHTGEFGVNVHPACQGLGIGRALTETLLKWARENESIEKVYLNVFHTNEKAIRLYKKLGFIEEGRHVNAVKQLSGQYVDVIQMYVDTKN